MFLFFLLIAPFVSLFSLQNGKQELGSAPRIDQHRVIIESLDTIVVNGSGQPVAEYVLKRNNKVLFYSCMNVIAGHKRELLKEDLENEYIGRPLTFAKIQKIKDQIQDFYSRHGQSLVIVQVNQQDVTNGVLVIDVIEARLGNLEIQGNQYFDSGFYKDQIHVKPNEIIQNAPLMRDIEYINRSPFRKADCVLKPGAQYGTSDIVLNVREVKPLRFFLGTDNTGFKVTDYTRLFVGFNVGGFLNDHLLSFQYIASPDFHEFQGFMLQYILPIYKRDQLKVTGGYSLMYPDLGNLTFPVHKGESWQISGRYVFTELLEKPAANLQQDIELGFDFKRTDNNFIVGEVSIFSVLVSIFQFAAGYNVIYEKEKYSFCGKLEGFLSPGKLSSSMSKQAYSNLRTNAANRYFFLRFDSKFNLILEKGFDLEFKFRGQVSTSTLLPIEQYGLGGENSVRGYTDRAYNADDALLFNVELIAPPIQLLSRNKPMFNIHDSFRGHIFLDIGVGAENSTVPNEEQSQTLVGIGPGFRYKIAENLNVRFDTGFPLTDIQGESYPARFYFGVVASF